MLAIVVILAPNKNGRHNRLALPAITLGLAAVLYVPGMIWLVLIGAIIQRKNIREARQATHAPWMRALSLSAGIILLVPLLYAFSKSPGLIRQWLGIHSSVILSGDGLKTVALTIFDVPKSLFISSSFDPVHWLGRLPLLSSFEIIMLLLGMYFYATHIRAARTRLILTLSTVAVLIIGFSGITAISLIVPIVYLLAAAGIAYILHLWLKVFPNNPVARTTGIVLILLTVLLTSAYQTRSYFVAWRYNSDTMQSFRTKL
jgi:succinate dehydrogenase hydrophobic anchor subunit